MKKLLSAPDLNREAKLKAFDRLLTIMDELRENCPWDKKQTLESLRHLTIEETYELSDAILEGDLTEIKKELGDLMLHNVFYARIAAEAGVFDVSDVLNSICDKLIVRHPHVYSDVVADDEKTVKENWEKIKLKTGNKSVLEGVPKSLPALVKSIRIQDKARGVGFDCHNFTLHHSSGEKSLTQKEAEVLKLLCENKDRVLKREEILKKVWGNDDYFLGRSMDVFISKLRKYLKEDPKVQIINYHGVGFKLEVNSAAQ